MTIHFDFTLSDGITATAFIGDGTANPDNLTGTGSPSWSGTPGAPTITAAEPNGALFWVAGGLALSGIRRRA